jgi:purine-cytosine permease-like protein
MQDNNLVGILIWVVGIIVSLAVGSGMIDETLMVPMIPSIITIISGWVVVVGAIISVILAVFNK